MSTQDSKQDTLRIGVDVGSTTVKLLVLDPNDEIIFSVYRRHHSDVRATIVEIIDEALEAVGDGNATITITGSGGLLLANWLGVPFVQDHFELVIIGIVVISFIPTVAGLIKAKMSAGKKKHQQEEADAE